jgi:hypothetical protein
MGDETSREAGRNNHSFPVGGDWNSYREGQNQRAWNERQQQSLGPPNRHAAADFAQASGATYSSGGGYSGKSPIVALLTLVGVLWFFFGDRCSSTRSTPGSEALQQLTREAEIRARIAAQKAQPSRVSEGKPKKASATSKTARERASTEAKPKDAQK